MCVFTLVARTAWSLQPLPRRGSRSTKGDLYIFLRLWEQRVAVRPGQARSSGPVECSRSAPIRVWTRGSSAGGAVSHSAPGGSVSALSARPAPAPCAWEVSAASASKVLAQRCFRAPAGNLQPEPQRSGSWGSNPYSGPSPLFAPQPVWGWLSAELSESPSPRETRLAALECRATSGTGLPQRTSVPHRNLPDTSILPRALRHTVTRSH